jgi:hypothetical protein
VGAVAVILGGWVWSCYHKGGMQLMHTIFIDQLFIARWPRRTAAG